MPTCLDRGEFFRKSGKFLAAMGLVLAVPENVLANHVIDDVDAKRPLGKQLKRYLKEITPEQKRWEEVLKNYRIFDKIEREAQVEDFKMYFPMYKAAEMEFGIPWQVFFVIHEDETNASRNKNPEASNYRGAMQLDPDHYFKGEIKNAAQGWEFLGLLYQRYTRDKHFATNDWEEIMRAGAYIQMRRRELRLSDKEESILIVLKKYYSSEENGTARLRRFNLMISNYQEMYPGRD